jgi:FkbM family methyltransferase
MDCYVRAIVRSDTEDWLVRLIEQIRGERATLFENIMDDAEFKAFLALGDVFVCPYLPSAFARRTSGMVVDAIILGRPFVAIEGTWLGDLARDTGAGIAARADAVSIVAAVKTIIADYPAYCAKAADARGRYLLENSWSTLLQTIVFGCRDDTPAFTQQVLIDQHSADRSDERVKMPGEGVMYGPFERESGASWDETRLVAELFGSILDGSTMVDVGAHHGTSLAPFLDLGWKIYAFEPDPDNRAKLIKWLDAREKKSLVTVDPRCVGEESKKGASFYQSEQSTGISGLTPFHSSHVQVGEVDVTTLSEGLAKQAIGPIDFLKIDSEGHDLFVLRGFPWDRGTPAVIECEFEDAKTAPLGYTYHDLAGFLVDKGYLVYVSEWHSIIRYGIKHDWRQLMRYPCELADPEGWGNLLAFRDPMDEGQILEVVKRLVTTQKPMADSEIASLKNTRESGKIDGRFHAANGLLRSGDFQQALQLYLDLYSETTLGIYEDNALWAARKLGLTEVRSAVDFVRDQAGSWQQRSTLH